MSTERKILVTGATGKQGGAVVKHLAGLGFGLRAMTRRPDSEAARALAQQGVEVVQGDFDDAASVSRAVEGVWGVFAMGNTWEAGVEREEAQGKRLARASREIGVSHYVYTSVGSAHRKTGIPHFDNKHRVEETVRSLRFPSHVILRPVFFMENVTSPWFLQGDKLVTALKPTTRLQMVAVDDIGKLGARAFERAEEMKGQEIDLAGDALTLPEAAALLGEAFGRTIDYQPIPIEMVRQNSEDMALMLEWFDRVGYDADIGSIEKKYGFRPLRFGEWARAQLGRA